MIRTVTSVVVVAIVLVAGTLLWRPHSNSFELTTAAMPPLEELHAKAGVHQLPDQDIDDQSLIFPAKTKR
jgi:hypothetical protein